MVGDEELTVAFTPRQLALIGLVLVAVVVLETVVGPNRPLIHESPAHCSGGCCFSGPGEISPASSTRMPSAPGPAGRDPGG